MSRKFITITDEEKELIVKDYLSEMATRDIYEKWDIHSHQLYAILDEMNIPKRYPSKSITHDMPTGIKKDNKVRCPHCKKQIPVLRGSKYCPYCAGDIRETSDIILERLNKLYLFVKEQPDAVAIITEIATLVKEDRR